MFSNRKNPGRKRGPILASLAAGAISLFPAASQVCSNDPGEEIDRGWKILYQLNEGGTDEKTERKLLAELSKKWNNITANLSGENLYAFSRETEDIIQSYIARRHITLKDKPQEFLSLDVLSRAASEKAQSAMIEALTMPTGNYDKPQQKQAAPK
jgi:hypothetical protein